MPKTNEKDAYFFSHDCNARNDPKILALRSVYGAEGYGVYFMLIEILREQPDYKLSVNKYIWSTLAMQMQVDASRLEQIITDCCTEFSEDGHTLLVNDGKYLFSTSLLRRMGKVDDISNLRREAARKRWENQPCKVSGGSDGCNGDANAEQSDANKRKAKQSKEKQSKGKETKADIFGDFASGDAELLSALQGFEEMRVKIKKPMTDRAKKLMLTELVKLSTDRNTQIAILNQSVSRSWAGVFALKDDQPSGGRRQQASTGDKMDALRDLHNEFSGSGT
nr:DUF4373 domain-containing protein [uncultured Oscillibacter sp.]